MKEREIAATVETAKKRINNMRSVFRKEMKKVSDSKKSGASTGDVLCSSTVVLQLTSS